MCLMVGPAGQNAETAMLIASLRDVIRSQAQQIEALQNQLEETNSGADEVRSQHAIGCVFAAEGCCSSPRYGARWHLCHPNCKPRRRSRRMWRRSRRISWCCWMRSRANERRTRASSGTLVWRSLKTKAMMMTMMTTSNIFPRVLMTIFAFPIYTRFFVETREAGYGPRPE